MNATRTILWKAVVRPYYRQNTSFFFFFFILLFGVVAPSHQLAYHYALIRGMLDSRPMLGLALFVWLLYAVKCGRWVTGVKGMPDHGFLQVLSLIGKRRLFLYLLEVQIWLYLPVLFYTVCVMAIAIHNAYYGMAIAIFLYDLAICLAGATLCKSRLYPGHNDSPGLLSIRFPGARRAGPAYWSFFMRFFRTEHKLMLVGIKLFGCLVLYGLFRDQGPGNYDIRMPYLLYSMALFGHGVLIYRAREMEEEMLRFYRSLPISLFRRWLQYVILYFLLLLPEMITVGWLTPEHIQLMDAIGLVLSAYSVLLLLNSCLFISPLKKRDFLKLSLGIFGILYFGVLSGGLILLSGIFFAVAGCLFFGGYYRYAG